MPPSASCSPDLAAEEQTHVERAGRDQADSTLTGHGTRGLGALVCGAITALGGLEHTLPYLIHNFNVSTTVGIMVALFDWQPSHGFATASWTRRHGPLLFTLLSQPRLSLRQAF